MRVLAQTKREKTFETFGKVIAFEYKLYKTFWKEGMRNFKSVVHINCFPDVMNVTGVFRDGGGVYTACLLSSITL